MTFEYKIFDLKDGVNPDSEHELNYLSRELSWELVSICSSYGMTRRFYFRRPVMCRRYLKSLGLSDDSVSLALNLVKISEEIEEDSHVYVNLVLTNPEAVCNMAPNENEYININGFGLIVPQEILPIIKKFAESVHKDF